MGELVVLVPVLARPHNAEPLVRSLESSTGKARVVFVCSPADKPQIKACRKTGAETLVVPWEPGRADWARKLEYARHRTTEHLMLLGADDIRFRPGWADAVLQAFDVYDVGVVGTNDLANPAVKRGHHSTHPVVCRGYADAHGTIDDRGLMLHQGYWHQYVDNELVDTAKARGCWLFLADAHVEHSHPIWRTAEQDATYERGTLEQPADRALFVRRQRLWSSLRVVR